LHRRVINDPVSEPGCERLGQLVIPSRNLVKVSSGMPIADERDHFQRGRTPERLEPQSFKRVGGQPLACQKLLNGHLVGPGQCRRRPSCAVFSEAQ